MNPLTIFLMTVIFIKISFVLLELFHIHLKRSGKENTKLDITITHLREKSETIFILLMAALLIYLFDPSENRTTLLNKPHIKQLLFLFGIVLIITADWNTLVK
jgi:hypothetical protein